MKIDALRRPFAPGTYDRRYVPVADGFRVLCVLFVGWFHIWQQSWLNPMLEIGGLRLDLSGPVRAGYMLVDMMILLSGFLLFLPYARSREDGEPLPDLRAYYTRRALRILPSYYLCVLITFFLYGLRGYSSVRSMLLDLIGHLTFTHNQFYESYIGTRLPGVLWTLAVEVQFYLIAPLIGRAFIRRPFVTYACMTAAAFFYRFVYVAGLSDSSLYFNVYANGMLAAWAFVRLGKRKRLRTSALAGCLGTLVCILAIWGVYRITSVQYRIPNGYQAIRWGQMIYRFPLTALGALFLIGGSFASAWFQFLFSNRLVRFLAGISYNFYIWHAHVALRLRAWHIPPYESEMPQSAGEQPWQQLYTYLCFIAALAVAAAVTYLWERPMNRTLSRLCEKRRRFGSK